MSLEDDGYTSEPTHLRIYREDTGDEWPWCIDGADDEGHYTEIIFQFATFEECLKHAGELVEWSTKDGVVWLWNAQRDTRIRQLSKEVK